MKRIIIIILTVLSLTAISAEPNQQGKTVTVPQEYLDSLEHAASLATQQTAVAQEAVHEATDQLRSEMESRYNTYVTHVGTIIGLLGILVGVLIPYLISKDFKDDMKKKLSTLEKMTFEANSHTIEAKDAAEIAKIYALSNQAYFEKDDTDMIITLYTKALNIASKLSQPWDDLYKIYNNRGSAYANKGDFVNAIKDFDKAIEMNPNDAEAYHNRALCCILLAEKETDKAKAKDYYQKAGYDCDAGLKRNPDEEVRKALEEKKRLCEERLKNL